MADTVAISIKLRCYAREDGPRWASWCPSLDVASQAASEADARRCLEEAIELWVESCLERNTLSSALEELGFSRVPAGQTPREHAETISLVSLQEDEELLGHPFPVEILIPAYQAAQLLAAR